MRPIPPPHSGSSRWLISFGIAGIIAVAAAWWLDVLPLPKTMLQIGAHDSAAPGDEDSEPEMTFDMDSFEPVNEPVGVEQWEPRVESAPESQANVRDPFPAQPPASNSGHTGDRPLFADDEPIRHAGLDFEERQSRSGNPASGVPASWETNAPQQSRKPVRGEIHLTGATESVPEEFARLDRIIDQGKYLEAHRDLSKLYWNKPEQMKWILPRIEKTAKIIYDSPQPHFMTPYEVQPGDLLVKIAPRYHVSPEYLAALNRIDPKKIRPGQKLKVINGPFAAFVDLSDFRLTIHAHGYFVKQFPIGIGKDNSTPIGTFHVKERLRNPTYYGPDGVVAADDPTNPLGECWIDLGDSYGIHGTIDPASIGKAESRGCIRLNADDIEQVFDYLTAGSEVVIRP